MLPILATLLQSGFSVLAGAVASKGKDLIESKLGVNLDDALGTETGRLELKRSEYAHEEFLIQSAQTANVANLDWFKAELADKADARSREVEVERIRAAPWWAPSTQTLLTFTVVIGSGYLFETSDSNELKYAVIAIATMVLQYYYGTNAASKGKDNTIAKLAEKAGQNG